MCLKYVFVFCIVHSRVIVFFCCFSLCCRFSLLSCHSVVRVALRSRPQPPSQSIPVPFARCHWASQAEVQARKRLVTLTRVLQALVLVGIAFDLWSVLTPSAHTFSTLLVADGAISLAFCLGSLGIVFVMGNIPRHDTAAIQPRPGRYAIDAPVASSLALAPGLQTVMSRARPSQTQTQAQGQIHGQGQGMGQRYAGFGGSPLSPVPSSISPHARSFSPPDPTLALARPHALSDHSASAVQGQGHGQGQGLLSVGSLALSVHITSPSASTHIRSQAHRSPAHSNSNASVFSPAQHYSSGALGPVSPPPPTFLADRAAVVPSLPASSPASGAPSGALAGATVAVTAPALGLTRSRSSELQVLLPHPPLPGSPDPHAN